MGRKLDPIGDGNHEGKIVAVYGRKRHVRPHGVVAIHLPGIRRYVLVKVEDVPGKPQVGNAVCVTAFGGVLIVNNEEHTPVLPPERHAA